MLQNQYTFTTNNVYDKRTFTANSSIYSKEGLNHPKTIEISHRRRKGSNVIDTVIINTDDVPVVNAVTGATNHSRVRAQLKISYDPLNGPADTAVILSQLSSELKELFDLELSSILNREV